jgi:hypothetical protein
VYRRHCCEGHGEDDSERHETAGLPTQVVATSAAPVSDSARKTRKLVGVTSSAPVPSRSAASPGHCERGTLHDVEAAGPRGRLV